MEIWDNAIEVDVIGFGALNMDKLFSVDSIACSDSESFILSKKNSPGGSAANTIIGLSKLGLKTSYIGKIAEDSDGEELEINLSLNGVYTNNLIYSESGSTGQVLGFVDKKGNRALYVNPGVNDEIHIGEINPFNLKTKIMHLSSFVGEKSFNSQIELLEKLDEDIILSFDPGMIYVEKGLNKLEKILYRTNILLINEIELRKLLKDDSSSIEVLIKKLEKYDIETIIVKKGSKGVFGINSNESCDVEGFKVSVVDSTCAGDSFNSGFLFAYLNNYSLKQSCMIANWIASKTIESYGMESFPIKKDLEVFLNSL